ncbi:hypothetical protein TNCV_2426431 [Trichonephila clavipes]|nr:hypothetical protein TNCV_2426431 [Trichonephila clavipes]
MESPIHSVRWLAMLTAVALGLGSNPGEDMDVCKRIVFLRYEGKLNVAAVAEWYRYRTVACFVTAKQKVVCGRIVKVLGNSRALRKHRQNLKIPLGYAGPSLKTSAADGEFLSGLKPFMSANHLFVDELIF